MNKGLDLIERQQIEIIDGYPTGNIFIGVTQEELTELEKELKALIVLKDLFDFDFALRFPSNQPMLRIANKRTNEYWEIPVTQEEYDLLKRRLKNV